ncbi:hypothetical protein D3C86_1925700 [compost metagenome]
MVLLAKVVRVGAHYRTVAGGNASPWGRGAPSAQCGGMAELTRDGARTGAHGQVIATISKYWVIYGKSINSAY